MKHLLFLSTVFPTPWEPHKGPANANLVAAIRSLGYRVTGIAPVPCMKRMRARRSVSVAGTEYPVYWYVPGILRHHYHRTLGWSLQRTVARIAAHGPPLDAVLSFWVDPDGTAAVNFGRQLGIPSGVIAAGSDIMLLPSNPARRVRVARTLQSADHVFGVGSEIVRRAIRFGADPARVSSFIQGVNLDHFRPGDRQAARDQLRIPATVPLLLWVGNMVDVKAAERVILAARELVTSFPDLHVALVGSGPREGSLRTLAATSGAVADRIIFAGSVASEKLPQWYQAANVMVLPSRSEGVPNVLLEAMACGLPFVASEVGSISDLLPFGPSRTVIEGDLDALRHAIGEVLTTGSEVKLTPKRYDLLDGAREIIHHLHLDRP